MCPCIEHRAKCIVDNSIIYWLMKVQSEFREEIECCLYHKVVLPDTYPPNYASAVPNPGAFCAQSHKSFCLIQHCPVFGLLWAFWACSVWWTPRPTLRATLDSCLHHTCCSLYLRISHWTLGQRDGWWSAWREGSGDGMMAVMLERQVGTRLWRPYMAY